jgi:azurin
MMNLKRTQWQQLLAVAGSAICLLQQPAQAADKCDVSVDATDQMTFSVKEIAVPKACKSFTINLKHAGAMKKTIMGHNLVVSKQADEQGVLQDGSKAGAAQSYVKPQDPRVVAATTVIGGGETASTSFAPSHLDAAGNYVFFCSFPGHAALMKGTLKLI